MKWHSAVSLQHTAYEGDDVDVNWIINSFDNSEDCRYRSHQKFSSQLPPKFGASWFNDSNSLTLIFISKAVSPGTWATLTPRTFLRQAPTFQHSMNIKVIAFDADDTLWDNENYFQEIEKKFCELMEEYLPQHSSARELLRIEIKNLPLYGYGIKAFMLSMIESAMTISNNTINISAIEKIIGYGQELLQKPIQKLEGVDEVLQNLKGRYRLVVATKGDLLDQERKLKKSGIEHYFHHTEIMSEKGEDDFRKLIKHLDIQPENFLMIGNSLKSDVLPVLNIGGHAFHIPYHITWGHEKIEHEVKHDNFKQFTKITEILAHL